MMCHVMVRRIDGPKSGKVSEWLWGLIWTKGGKKRSREAERMDPSPTCS
jgi:hypothetical protein